MKKIVSLLLSVVLVFSFSSVTHATSISYDYSDEDVQIVTPESFASLFSTDTIDEVLYNYTLIPQDEAETDIANVTLDFEFKIGDKSYGTTINGCVGGYRLESGDILWQGPIKGIIDINETINNVIVGFSKLNSNENVKFTVTIQSDYAIPNENYLLAFAFGENVITKSILNELSQNTNGDASNAPDSNGNTLNASESNLSQNQAVETLAIVPAPIVDGLPNAGANGEWKIKERELTPFVGSEIGGYGLESRAYFWVEDNALAITTTSFCSNIENHFDNPPLSYAHTTISEFSVVLEVGEKTGTNNSYIAGIQTFAFENDDISKPGRALLPLFEDAMSLLNIPTSTISALVGSILGEFNTTVNTPHYTNRMTASVSFGLHDGGNFDNCSVGVPFIFQLAKSSPSYYQGNSVYNVTTSITYVTEIRSLYTNFIDYFYSSAEDAEMELTLTLG